MIQRIATRDGYGKRLAELDDNKIVVLAADLAESSRVNAFKDAHPDRFIQVGISEQDMFGMANGLGLSGKIPFTNTFASFCLRAADQIRLIAINNSNVKVVGHHAGINLGADGVSQMCEMDISLFRSMPNFTVVVPCDALEAQKAVDEMMKINGPCYLRLSREPATLITHEYSEFRIGKANIIKDGEDVLIVACGNMVQESLRAAKMLSDSNINACVMNMHTIKPLDKAALEKYASRCKAVVVAEEHSVYGGLGSAVCEALSISKIPVKCVGINDQFGESGKPDELFARFGIDAEHIAQACMDIARHKEAITPQVKEVEQIVREINHDSAPMQQPKAQNKDYGNDPRGRVVKMSDQDKAKVDAVLRGMFGGRRS